MRKHVYLALIACTLMMNCRAQEPGVPDSSAVDANHPETYYGINRVFISGNHKTRESIIQREIPFHDGEAYAPRIFWQRMNDARKQLMNTALFHSVTVTPRPTSEEGCYDIYIDVKERWYVFPVPYFKPADRNLNQWLFERNGDMSRVNYGAKLMYNNITGRNDKLRASMIFGYTKQLGLSYSIPYIDRRMRWGMYTGFIYGKAHEMNYNTVGDKQVFVSEPGYIRNFFNANLAFTYRRAIRAKHHFGINYTTEQVGDTVTKLNPYYFPNGRSSIGYPTFYYTLDYFDLDYIPYPTQGYAARISFSKSGVNHTINLWQLHAKGSAYWSINSRSFFNLNLYGGIKFPFKQPWFVQRFFGYGDVFLQGYEYYVVDGVAGGYGKVTFTRELFKMNVPSPHTRRKLFPEKIPFRFYGKIYGNAGYAYNPQPGDNDLSNRLLFSGGIGIDIITIYDLSLRLEWSFNQLGQNGLFLHPKTIF